MGKAHDEWANLFQRTFDDSEVTYEEAVEDAKPRKQPNLRGLIGRKIHTVPKDHPHLFDDDTEAGVVDPT